MPTNVGLRNTAASGFTDTFLVEDLVAGGAVVARLTIRGGDVGHFNCESDDQGYGDVNVTRADDGAVNHYDFVRDGQVLTF